MSDRIAIINRVIVSKYNNDLARLSVEGRGFGNSQGNNFFYYKNQEVSVLTWRDDFMEGLIPLTDMDEVREYYDSIQDNFNIYNVTATFAFKINSREDTVYSTPPCIDSSLISGTGTFNSVQGRVITIGRTLTNINYKVFLRVKSSTYTDEIGQYFVADKTTTQFTVKNLGINSDAEFEWFVIPYENSMVFSGTSFFNGPEGRTVEIGGILPCTNYRVLVNPVYTSLTNQVGEVAVFNKTKSSFIVKNSGEDTITRFDWIVISDGAIIFKCGENESPVLTGTSTFNSLEGRVVNLDFQQPNVNYRVVITTTDSITTQVGEVVVFNKATTYFTIKNTGEDVSSSFDWILIPSYDNNNYCQTGTSMFNSNEGVQVWFENVQDDLDYKIIITPKDISLTGDIGDYYISEKFYNYFVVKNTGANDYDYFDWTIVPKDNDMFKSGTSTFNSLNGRLVSFPNAFPDYNYKVSITPMSSTALDGNLGAIGITNKLSTGFTLVNTGENDTASFDWVAVDFNNVQVLKGIGTFNSTSGTIINLPIPQDNINYTVCLIPNNLSTSIGEYGVFDKKTNQFTVRNTGEDITTTFDWFIVPFRFRYFDNNYYVGTQVYMGNSVFNGLSGRVVPIGITLPSNRYNISIMPQKSELMGKIGDFGVVGKTRSQFIVKNSGEDVNSGFDWILVAEDDSISGTAIFNGMNGRVITFENPLNVPDYNVYLSYEGELVTDIGDWFVLNKTVNGFEVRNTGINHTSLFEWRIVLGKTASVTYTYDYKIKPMFKQLGSMAFEDNIEDSRLPEGRITNGVSVFNSLEGRDILFNYPLKDSNYFVGVIPQENSPDIGDITVIDKRIDGFTVKNWGTDSLSKFDWILIPDNKNYEDFVFGKMVFNAADGVKIKLPHKMNDLNYFVFVSPITKEINGDIGSIIVTEKELDSFIVRNTGTNRYSLFEYVVIPEVRESYYSASGASVFNSVDGIVVPIGRELPDANYKVFLSVPVSDSNIGEYYVSNKFRTHFIVKNTGTDTSSVFNWILLDDSDTYTENIGKDVFNSITGRRVYLNRSLPDDNYSVYIMPQYIVPTVPIVEGSSFTIVTDAVTGGTLEIHGPLGDIISYSPSGFFEMVGSVGEMIMDNNIGNISITDRTKDYFVVSNTGTNKSGSFDWIAVSHLDSTFYRGRSRFNGDVGVDVSIGTSIDPNYNVMITPIHTFNNGEVGEITTLFQNPTDFTLTNTGTDDKTGFNWAVPNKIDFTNLTGRTLFNSISATIVTFNTPLPTNDYHVFITPSDYIVDGKTGDFGVIYKHTNYFIVENSGEGLGYFDWVVIPNDPNGKVCGNSLLLGNEIDKVITLPYTPKENYKVFLAIDATINNSIGQIILSDKMTNSIKVKNSGINEGHGFDYLAITESDFNSSSLHGVSTFNGMEGTVVNLPAQSDLNYQIYIEDVNGNSGEYAVTNKNLTSFTVRNTGTVGGDFNWVLVVGSPYGINQGSSNFNSVTGTVIDLTVFPDTNYKFMVTPHSYLNGDIGVFEVTNREDSSFIVKNTGGNSVCKFSWFLLDSNQFIANGSVYLEIGSGSTGYAFTSSNYSVIMTPRTNMSLKVGDYGVISKSPDTFNFKVTGEEIDGYFDWFAFPKYNFIIESGTGDFNGTEGTVVSIMPQTDLNYKVYIKPMDGYTPMDIEEFYVCYRTLNSFIVKNSKEDTTTSFDYIVVPDNVKYVPRGTDVLNSTWGRVVNFQVPIVDGNYSVYYNLDTEISNNGQHYYVSEKGNTTFKIHSKGDNQTSLFDWILVPNSLDRVLGNQAIPSLGKIISLGRKMNNKNYFVGAISTSSSPDTSSLCMDTRSKTQFTLYCQSNLTNNVDYTVLPSKNNFNISGVARFAGIGNSMMIMIGSKMPNNDYKVFIHPLTPSGFGNVWVDVKSTTFFTVINTGADDITFEWIILPSRNKEMYLGRSVLNSVVGRNVCIDEPIDTVNYKVFITPNRFYDENVGNVYVTNKSIVDFDIVNTGANTFTNFDWMAVPEADVFNNI